MPGTAAARTTTTPTASATSTRGPRERGRRGRDGAGSGTVSPRGRRAGRGDRSPTRRPTAQAPGRITGTCVGLPLERRLHAGRHPAVDGELLVEGRVHRDAVRHHGPPGDDG